MKVKALVASIALMGVAHAQTTVFETAEYRLSTALKPVNASFAYSRGYTGKNSVIAIVDSGIDTSSPEFKNKILFIKDFSASGTPIDRIGHGTHVAGIAAANRDGFGVHGVAYDSKLVIAKVTDNGSVNTNNLLSAATWAAQTGADVVNMSLGWQLSQSYLNAKQIGTGMYSTKFSNTGMLPISSLFKTEDWVKALQGESVVVFSAGNDKTKWSQGLTGLATLTDTKGNLVFGGRIIIAGNYDSSINAMNISSNGPGHLCQTVVRGVMNQEYCADKYKTWEFYILAPGTAILSTVPKAPGIPQRYDASLQPTGLASMTGTSMSAPVVSGAVAIIHQMWPQMKGANIVKLLLVTANKNIPGYNLYVHGQGLLDLEKATRPIGNLGIPTTGRLAGPNLANVRPLVYTGGSASTGGLTGLMVVDSFERDFYMPGKMLTGYKAQSEFNFNQMLMTYDSKNTYALFNNYTNHITVANENIDVTVYKNFNDNVSPAMIELGHTKKYDNTKVRFTTGTFSENHTWLGNSIGSFVGDGNNKLSQTYFASINIDTLIGNTKLYGSYYTGMTNTKAHSENITHIGKISSDSYSMGVEQLLNNNKFGLMFYKPVVVKKAIADLVAPVGLDNEFNVIQNSKINLAAQVREMRLGFYHKFEDKKEYKTMAFIENRYNYRGQEGVRDTAVGFSITKWFN